MDPLGDLIDGCGAGFVVECTNGEFVRGAIDDEQVFDDESTT